MTISDFIKRLTIIQKQYGPEIQVKLASGRDENRDFVDIKDYIDVFSGISTSGRYPEQAVFIIPSNRWEL